MTSYLDALKKNTRDFEILRPVQKIAKSKSNKSSNLVCDIQPTTKRKNNKSMRVYSALTFDDWLVLQPNSTPEEKLIWLSKCPDERKKDEMITQYLFGLKCKTLERIRLQPNLMDIKFRQYSMCFDEGFDEHTVGEYISLVYDVRGLYSRM